MFKIVSHTQDGQPWIVMEYISGGTLLAYVKSHQPLPLSDVLLISTQIASGMRHLQVTKEKLAYPHTHTHAHVCTRMHTHARLYTQSHLSLHVHTHTHTRTPLTHRTHSHTEQEIDPRGPRRAQCTNGNARTTARQNSRLWTLTVFTSFKELLSTRFA